eukprot:50272-Pyramimonas_sp.AAC.2
MASAKMATDPPLGCPLQGPPRATWRPSEQAQEALIIATHVCVAFRSHTRLFRLNSAWYGPRYRLCGSRAAPEAPNRAQEANKTASKGAHQGKH